jgi:hypothetical protein
MELLEELPEPTSFGHAIGHGAVLSLNARVGDDVLELGRLGDEVVAEEYNITRGGPTCIWATRPVSLEEEVEHHRWRPKSREPRR